MKGDTILMLGVGAAAAYFVWKNYASTPAASSTATTTTTMPAVTPVTQLGAQPGAQVHQLPVIQSAFEGAERAAFGTDPALSGDASNPTASYNVHNYYLTLPATGVTSGLLSWPQTGSVPMYDFWAQAAARLQEKIPGLYGMPDAVRAGLGALAADVRRRKGW